MHRQDIRGHPLMASRKLVSLGDAGLHIKSSTIQIPSRPDLIIDYNMNPIPTTDSSRQTRFQFKFNPFLIKVNLFRCNFDLLIKIRSTIID